MSGLSDEVREQIAAALPASLQPVGAGLKNPRSFFPKPPAEVTEAERLTGYGELLADALAPLIREAEARGAAAVVERVEAAGAPEPDARMDAYYYGFDRTGVGVIDAVLSVLAYAGKAYHHTSDWQDDMPWDSGPIRKGETCADAIQRVANESAAALRSALATQPEAVRDA